MKSRSKPIRGKTRTVHKKPDPKPVKPITKLPKQGLEVEFVRPAMRKKCLECATVPAGKRLLVKKGGGKFQSQDVLCVDCGKVFLSTGLDKLGRMLEYLSAG